MNDNPDSHEFDWVTARNECSLPNEFERLRLQVKALVSKRKMSLTPDAAVKFEFDDREECVFQVTRSPSEGNFGKAYTAEFALRNDHILVTSEWVQPVTKWALTLTLNELGECRFIVNGKGEYWRWQVTRCVLYGLFFEGPRRLPA